LGLPPPVRPRLRRDLPTSSNAMLGRLRRPVRGGKEVVEASELEGHCVGFERCLSGTPLSIELITDDLVHWRGSAKLKP